MKDIFRTIIYDFIQKDFKNIFPRDYNIPLSSKKIISIVGIRRSGKTYTMFNIINQLRKIVSRENIIYVNFEDDRLFGLQIGELDGLIDTYFEIFPEKRKERIYLFFDEIENIKGWEKFVRRLYDTLNVSIYITGSSSRLLKKEFAYSLRGRTITYEIFPLTFKEYLLFHNIKPYITTSESKSRILNLFNSFLEYGGFPELIGEDEDIRRRILSDYVDLIVYRDIIERYGVKNTHLLRFLIKYSFSNPSTLLSINKLYNQFKSMGLKAGKDTLYDFFEYLEDSFVVFNIPIFASSIKEQHRNPKKLYIADNGFKFIFNTSFSKDYSKLLENTVFLHLRKKYENICYFKDKQEVDFLITYNGIKHLVNVSYSVKDPDTRGREIKGLLSAMDYLNINTSFIITAFEEEEINIQNKKIFIVPFYKWSLSNYF